MNVSHEADLPITLLSRDARCVHMLEVNPVFVVACLVSAEQAKLFAVDCEGSMLADQPFLFGIQEVSRNRTRHAE